MRFKLPFLVGAMAVAVGAVVALSLKTLAQSVGEKVDFLVPDEIAIGCGGLESPRIVVTGPSQGTTAVGGTCGAGEWHIQQIVAICPGTGAAATRADAIFQITEPLRPGTELIVETALGSCDGIDGTRYIIFRGIVTRGHDSQGDSGEPVQTRVELLQPSCGCGQAE